MIINGTIIEKFPSKRGAGAGGKPWVLNSFSILKDDDETLKCSTFGAFNADVGDSVSLSGELDAKYNTFKVVKATVLAGDAPEAEATAPTPVAKKALATSVKPKAVAVAVATDDGREKNRTLAVASVKSNLESAIALKAELGLETVDLIALADMVGRTISAITIGQTKRY